MVRPNRKIREQLHQAALYAISSFYSGEKNASKKPYTHFPIFL